MSEEEYIKLLQEIHALNLRIDVIIADITSVRNSLMFHEMKFHAQTEEPKDWGYIPRVGDKLLVNPYDDPMIEVKDE